MRGPWHHFAVAIGVVAVGGLFLALVPTIEAATGYAGVGARFFPAVIGAGLVALGFALAFDSWRHGFVGVDEREAAATPTDWVAFAWISASLLAAGLAIEAAGFILACTLLFLFATRAFGDRRYIMNSVVGLVLAAAVFAAFNYGLGLTLPVGFLPIPKN
jgi:putative tricarboxylic transport membrane protein